jgi:hypothetical protein
MTTTSKVYGSTPEVKTGLGHQLKKDPKSFQAAFDSLNAAFDHLLPVKNASALRDEIIGLMIKCNDLKIAAEDAYNQND